VGAGGFGIARQHRGHKLVQRRRQIGPVGPQARDRAEEDLGQDRVHVVGGERGPSGQALEQQAAQREDVGGPSDLPLAAGLLGRHVARRAEHRAGAGERVAVDHQPRQAEIEQDRSIRRSVAQEHVPRLDVAMDDLAPVGHRERLRQPAHQQQAVVDRERLAVEPASQVFALEPLHDQEGVPIVEGAVRHMLHDPGVIQVGQEASLAFEPGQIQRSAAVHEHLHGHRSVAQLVARAIDHSRAAAARQRVD
jgi:hypothetical protein